MVRIVLLWLMLCIGIFAQDSFERNCIPCHRKLPTNLQEMFKHYLLVYSGEETTKAAMKHYMRYPSRDISVMSDLFINTYGVKKRLRIDDKQLDDAINIYWEKYKVLGKLH